MPNISINKLFNRPYQRPQNQPGTAQVILPATCFTGHSVAISLREKFFGVLLAVAVGDALGCNLEQNTPEQIQARYGIHRDITGGQPTPTFPHTWPKGAVTDDTEMTLMIADSLIAFPQGNIWDIRDRFVRWIKTNPPGTGKSTVEALRVAETLDLEKDAIDTGAKAAWEKFHTAGNGSIMRCSPIALLYHQDREKLIRLSDEVARITHYAPESRAASIAYNLILADIINDTVYDKASLKHSLENAAKTVEPLSPVIARAILAVPQLKKEQLQTTGLAVNALQISLWAVYNHNRLEEALIDIVNLGGDADTNAAVTGALFGALQGEKAIPARWLNSLIDLRRIQETAHTLHQTWEKGLKTSL